MNIGIIGVGVVGGATAEVLKKKHKVYLYDKYKKEYKNLLSLAKNAEVVFICVPTPMLPSGEMDYSAVESSIMDLSFKCIWLNRKDRPVIVIRSTAVSGTTNLLAKKFKDFRFAFNPEFLKEKTAVQDMKNTDRIVIGTNDVFARRKLYNMYRVIFPKAKYVFTNIKTAEMIKYCANVMLTAQIAAANELYQICNVTGIDYDVVKNAILLDERIGRNIDVPGPDGELGFGGKCFPKDLNALIYLARENYYRPYLLEEMWRLNLAVRKNKDWLKIEGATSKR